MSFEPVHEGPARGAAPQSVFPLLRARMSGPGGLYNTGNALGLGAGLTMQVLVAREATVWDFFLGSPSAVALSLAMVIFFWSGECYYRAWLDPARPDARLNRKGDWLSGLGAAFLGLGMLGLGQPLMALSAGGLHALGKFGSAYGWRFGLSDTISAGLWRALVPLSRVPAILLLLVGAWTATSVSGILEVTLLLGAYALWCAADFALWRGASA
jgi:hypothetical protein